jgi:hypothetical protein
MTYGWFLDYGGKDVAPGLTAWYFQKFIEFQHPTFAAKISLEKVLVTLPQLHIIKHTLLPSWNIG